MQPMTGCLVPEKEKRNPALKRLEIFFPAILWTVILLALCLAPGNDLPDMPLLTRLHFDKLVHFCLFGGFVIFWSLAVAEIKPLPITRYVLFFTVLSIVLGIAVEFMQKYWIPGRDFEYGDMITDAIGAITCAILFGRIRRLLESLRGRNG
jgi:VanZ family protein